MKRKHGGSKKYHNRVAAQYDSIYQENPYWFLYDDVTWAHMKRFLPESAQAQVLDVGCGTGKWGLRLLKSGYPVTFTDHSPQMIQQVRKKLDQMTYRHTASVMVSDLMDLKELDSDQYDFVVAQGDPLSLVSDARQAVRALYRVMKPGATLVCSVDNRWAGLDYHLDSGALKDVIGFLKTGSTHWLTKDRQERFPIHMFFPKELRRLFADSGFVVVDMLAKLALFRHSDSELLANPAQRRQLVKLELKYGHQEAAFGRAPHMQIVVEKK